MFHDLLSQCLGVFVPGGLDYKLLRINLLQFCRIGFCSHSNRHHLDSLVMQRFCSFLDIRGAQARSFVCDHNQHLKIERFVIGCRKTKTTTCAAGVSVGFSARNWSESKTLGGEGPWGKKKKKEAFFSLPLHPPLIYFALVPSFAQQKLFLQAEHPTILTASVTTRPP